MKRVMSILLTVALLLSLIPVGVQELVLSVAAESEGYFTYWVGNGEAVITDVDTAISGDVVIPSILGGYPVTSIGGAAFKGCTELTSVTIPDGVTSIGNSAFIDCTALASVLIGDGVTSIGSSVFWDTAYYNNETNWENGVLYIGKHLISAKENIEGSYCIKEGTKTIAGCALEDCAMLTSVTIPDSVTSIGDGAFGGCALLATMDIPDSVTNIGSSAFRGCVSLMSVYISENVTSLGSAVFWGTAYYNNETNWENGVLYMGNYLIVAKENVEGSYCIKEGTKTIADHALEDCTALTAVDIPSSVTSIGNYAFRGCDLLVTMDIPDSVTRIGDDAFSDCTALTSVTIGNNVTSIGNRVFQWCKNLTRITIPDSVTSFGSGAFYDCTALTDVYYSGSEEERSKIAIAEYNDALFSATWHYNYVYVCNHVNTAVENAKDATCAAEGYTGDTVCADCSETVTTGLVVPMIDHTYTDETDMVCNTCGYEREALTTVADVDGSGKIDSTDARLVLQYAVKKIDAAALTVAAADVDGSGKVDSTDARLILQFAVKKIKQFPAA